ncbi:MAG: hypothetical protein K5905_29170, partial [Roseibium sp.]|nr:hypothetical protein [Roseibium sp.]
MPILVDISRIISRRNASAPTGIDRTEIAYAQHFLDREDTRFTRCFPRLGIREINNTLARQFIADLAERWRQSSPRNTEEYEDVRSFVENSSAVTRPETHAPDRKFAYSDFDQALRFLPSQTKRTDGDIFIHVSHMYLDRPGYRGAFERVAPRKIFFVHDLIPITHAEYARPQTRNQHVERLKTITAFADAVVVNSETTKSALVDYIEQGNHRRPDIVVAPLGIDHFDPPVATRQKINRRYFIYVSTIEARKNHAFLLML